MTEEQEQATTQGTTKKAARKRKAASPGATVSPGTSAARCARKKADPGKPAAPRTTAKATPVRRQVSPEERYRMIQEAAYFRAEKEGFHCDPWKCWLVAEADVDAQLDAQA